MKAGFPKYTTKKILLWISLKAGKIWGDYIFLQIPKDPDARLRCKHRIAYAIWSIATVLYDRLNRRS